MISTNQRSCTVLSQITSVGTEGRQKGNTLLKNMLHFFLQAKPHTYSTTVSPYYKASVISSPWGSLIWAFRSHERPAGKAMSRSCKSKQIPNCYALYSSPVRCCSTSYHDPAVQTLGKIKGDTPARGTPGEKARLISTNSNYLSRFSQTSNQNSAFLYMQLPLLLSFSHLHPPSFTCDNRAHWAIKLSTWTIQNWTTAIVKQCISCMELAYLRQPTATTGLPRQQSREKKTDI